MTFEERLEKLTERHEALSESLELLSHSVHEQGENINKLITIMEKQAGHIDALLQVANNHEQRLRKIEGQ
jgi:uncharacterized protein Yka (UPF0111/DUF47 family)